MSTRNMIKRAAAVVLAALLLGGCGAGNYTQGSGTDKPDTVGETYGAAETAPGSDITEAAPETDKTETAPGTDKAETGEATGTDRTTDAKTPEAATGIDIPLSYATGFTIREYEDGCHLITVNGEDSFYTVPKGGDEKNAPEGAAVIEVPADDIYLAASGAMDMFIKAGAMGNLKYSSTDADGWYLPEAKKALESGRISYVGKYSAPDYELLLRDGCHLAIENTMIYHNPTAAEKLEELGIPVLIDQASREDHPLGRMEWIKLYGLLTGRYDEAVKVFDEQVALAGNFPDTGKTVAFFYFASDGTVSVRRSDDYIPAMIKMAGGKYIFDDLTGDNELSTENIQMEEFYTAAKDADYLIYNGMITGDVESSAQLVKENPLMASFKAVSEGRVYQASKNFYQSSMSIGTMISDMRLMLEDAGEGYVLLKKLE